VRRITERLSRGVVLRRRLPRWCGGARLFVTPECGLSYWIGVAHDKSLLRNAVELVRPRASVWDVGANQGIFAFAAAGLAGPEGSVSAFEPDTFLVSLLRRSAKLNTTIAPVETIPSAVSDRVGLARLRIAARARSANALEGAEGSTQMGGVRESHTVMTVTLDWCLQQGIRPPSVVKIDVEGAEVNVLRGASELLRRIKPAILIEVRATHRDEIACILREAGYSFYNSEATPGERVPLDLPAYNTLALHSSEVSKSRSGAFGI
jgi:FkbM family methyltransferase